jgi:hypothetical protein
MRVELAVAKGYERAERKGGALGRGRSRGLGCHHRVINEARLSHEMHEILKDSTGGEVTDVCCTSNDC